MINQNLLSLLSFGKRCDTGREGIIIRDNPAEHCFFKVFNSNELFQIIHDCENEKVHHRQNVW